MEKFILKTLVSRIVNGKLQALVIPLQVKGDGLSADTLMILWRAEGITFGTIEHKWDDIRQGDQSGYAERRDYREATDGDILDLMSNWGYNEGLTLARWVVKVGEVLQLSLDDKERLTKLAQKTVR